MIRSGVAALPFRPRDSNTVSQARLHASQKPPLVQVTSYGRTGPTAEMQLSVEPDIDAAGLGVHGRHWPRVEPPKDGSRDSTASGPFGSFSTKFHATRCGPAAFAEVTASPAPENVPAIPSMACRFQDAIIVWCASYSATSSTIVRSPRIASSGTLVLKSVL